MKLKGFLTMKNQLIYMTINNDNSILRFLYSNKIYLYLKKTYSGTTDTDFQLQNNFR